MRVLVTGGTGFIGRHVAAEASRRGIAARLLSRTADHLPPLPAAAAEPTRTGDARSASIEIVAHDLTRREGLADILAGCDAVIHLAASMHGDLAAQRADTVDGTRHLLAAMEEAGLRHIIAVSSLAVYDYRDLPVGGTLDEDAPLDDEAARRAPYVWAKREQERLVREHGEARGWRWTVLRPGIVFGPGRTWFYHLGAKLSARLWLCLAPDAPLPVTYVEHCARAIVLALGAGAARGATLNIVDTELPTRGSWVDALARRTRPRPRIVRVPWSLLDGSARAAGAVDRVLFRGRAPLPGLLRSSSLHARCKPLRYPNRRARETLDWAPHRSLAEALERSLAPE